jgi:hypothetical protein
VYVEGKLESAFLMEQTIKLQIMKGVVEVASSSCVLTVTPVLTDLQVFSNLGTGPFLHKMVGEEEWYITSAVGGNMSGKRSVASAKWNKVPGKLRFIQTASLSSNLPNGQGADLGQKQYKFDYGGANAGKSVVDCDDQEGVPFYTTGETQSNDDGVATRSIKDSPRLFLSAGPDNQFVNSVLPAVGGTTKVDVTYNFITHAVIQYVDKSIYCLGQQPWNVRFQGSVTPNAPGQNPKYLF